MTTLLRWRITGTFTLVTPMHLGSGEDEEAKDLPHGEDDQPTWVAAVARDTDDAPYVPGPSLKGALRALAAGAGVDAQVLTRLFGEGGGETAPGQVEFCNAYLTHRVSVSALPQFNGSRQTAYGAHAPIDRNYGTVVAQKLFHEPIVPPGAGFGFECTIDGLAEGDIAVLLAVLSRSADPVNGLRLGAGKASECGRVSWTLAPEGVQRFDDACIPGWLAALALKPQHWWETAKKQVNITPVALSRAGKRLRVPIELRFHTPFLVNDPWIGRHPDGEPDMKPRADHAGKIVLPADSLHGALHSQAERILRTLGCDTSQGHEVKYVAGHAMTDLATLLFGASGWRSLVELSDFVGNESVSTLRADPENEQELIAIDRFTGGNKRHAKYKVRYAQCPTLRGSLTLDLDRLARARMAPSTGHDNAAHSALGLLLLLLRDLGEGDIALGYGKSKGYGQCTSDALSTLIKQIGGVAGVTPEDALAAFRLPYQQLPKMQVGTYADTTVSCPTPGTPQGDFHNPYVFLPVSAPADKGQWSEYDDIPEAHHSHWRYSTKTSGGGLVQPVFNGRIVCRLEAKTPIFVGARRQPAIGNTSASVSNFRLRNRNSQSVTKPITLPATSLRGSLSSLGEALSQSALRVLEDRALSYRKETGQALSAMGIIRERNGEIFLEPVAIPTLEKNQQRGTFDLPRRFWECFRHAPSALKTLIDALPPNFQPGDFYYLKVPELSLEYYDDDVYEDGGVWFQSVDDDGNEVPGFRFPSDDHETRYLIGRASEEHRPSTQAEFDSFAEGKKEKYVRGYVRTLKLPARVDALPNTVKHYLFIPYPVYRDGTADNARGLVRVPPHVVDLFHELADERTAATCEPPSILTVAPFHPRGTVRNDPTALRPDDNLMALRLKEGDIVYFDVDDGGEISEVSYSAIWRGSVLHDTKRYSTRDFFAAIDPDLVPIDGNSARTLMSPAELMFGFVQDGKATGAIAAKAIMSKVRFGYGRLPDPKVSDEDVLCPSVALKILGAPKPPSPATYFKMRNAPIAGAGYIRKSELAASPTLFDPQGIKAPLHALRNTDGSVAKLGVAGNRDDGADAKLPWETRYPDKDRKQKVTIRPIRSGTSFFFEVDFVNLSEHELKLLCAILHPHETYEHKIGMGKPIGLGSVKITPVGMFLVDRVARYASDDLDANRYANIWKPEAGSSTTSWGEALRREFCMVQTPQWVSPYALSSQFMAELASNSSTQPLLRAILLTGNHKAVKLPVHYPQLHGCDIESKTYQWFVENDGGPKNATENSKRSKLAGFEAASTTLPALRRNPRG